MVHVAVCSLSYKIIRCQDEKLLEAEVQESKMLAETNQRNDIVKEVMMCTLVNC